MNKQYLQTIKLAEEIKNDTLYLKKIEKDLQDIIEKIHKTGYNDFKIMNQNRLFDGNNFDKIRLLKQSELDLNETIYNSSYIISVDVGRVDNTSICVFRRSNSLNDNNKFLVHLESYNDTSFEILARRIKFLVSQFHAKAVVIDGNGIGMGLIDSLVHPTKDIENNIYFPYSVINDSRYDRYKTKDSIPMIYIIKPTQKLHRDMAFNCLEKINSNQLKVLVHEEAIKPYLLNNKYMILSNTQLHKKIKPYVLTTELKRQLLNLQSSLDKQGNLKLQRIDNRISMDLYYAFIYGLWYI